MISSLIRFIISICLIGLLAFVLRKDIPTIVETVHTVDLSSLIIGLGFTLLGACVMGLRLSWVFKAQNITLSWVDGIKTTYIGLFFNNFLPTSVGGDIAKTYCIATRTKDAIGSISGVFMDRVFALFIFILTPSITVVFLADNIDPRVTQLVLMVLFGALVFLLLIFFPKILKFLAFAKPALKRVPGFDQVVQIYQNMHGMSRNLNMVSKIMGASFFGQMLNFFSIYMLSISIGAHINITYFFMAVPVIFLFSMLPSINGLGIREAGFVYFFSDSMGSGGASTLAILYLSYMIAASIIGGIVYATHKEYHFNANGLKAWMKTNSSKEQSSARNLR
ncbi:MAG: hypothetical protein ACI9CF_000262 [Candidatus Omnitrophota bacterium]|jgi:uncharacterized protein (TIRG00374 family)